MVATERIVTLGESLESLTDRGPKRDNYIAWGIFQVCIFIIFLTCITEGGGNDKYGFFFRRIRIFVSRAFSLI